MIVLAAVFCLIVVLLCGGLLLLELAVRLLPWALAALGWTLEFVLWLAPKVVAASRAFRRRGSSWSALRTAA